MLRTKTPKKTLFPKQSVIQQHQQLNDQVSTKLFFHSESWELEKYAKSIEVLDRIFIRKLIQLHENEENRKNRIKNLVEKANFLQERVLPILKQYYKENTKHHSKYVMEYFKHEDEMNNLVKEINCRNRGIDFLIEIEDDLENRIKKYKKTRRFLRKTVEESSTRFKSINDLLDRFIYLLGAKENLLDKISSTNNLIMDRQLILKNINNENESEILQVMNKLSEIELNKAEQDKRIQCLKDRFIQAHEQVFDNTLNIGQVQLGIENLYHRLSEKLNQLPTIESYREQLRYIRVALNEIKKLNKTVHDIVTPKSSVALDTALSAVSASSTE